MAIIPCAIYNISLSLISFIHSSLTVNPIPLVCPLFPQHFLCKAIWLLLTFCLNNSVPICSLPKLLNSVLICSRKQKKKKKRLLPSTICLGGQ